MNPTVIVLMGVAGAGKTTIGTELAQRLGWRFYDADDLHSDANRRKMAAGVPLTDADRAPWLEAIRTLIDRCVRDSTPAVLACSALKRSYRDAITRDAITRDVITTDPPVVRFVFLDGPPELIAQRLAARKDHFFDPALLQTQLDTLEIPDDKVAITADISPPPSEIVEAVIQRLGLDPPG
jgi:gluconokinase